MYKLLIITALSGCTPYVGYTHLSSPYVTNDGYDFACIGMEIEYAVKIDTGICQDMTANDGEFIKIDARYLWK